MVLLPHGPEPCASANSATSASCGRWDLNPHEHTPTRSLVLPVCQFQHFRICWFVNSALFAPAKRSIAQTRRGCKHFFYSLRVPGRIPEKRKRPGSQHCASRPDCVLFKRKLYLRDLLLRELSQLSKSLGIGNRHLGEHLAVHLNTGLL